MTKRKDSKLAKIRRERKEQRINQTRADQVARAAVQDDIDPAELLKATKLIIHNEVKRMAKAQAAGEFITPNDSKKLSQMITTIKELLVIKEKTKPDLSGLSEEELERLATGSPAAPGASE